MLWWNVEWRGRTVREYGWTSIQAEDAAEARIKFERMHPMHQVRAVSLVDELALANT